ncbi:MAG: PilN domain-containing protein [Bdellovibrionaceae bacterium]|nr:PilN domain-containing protein [Pseudobdellovibrionaceae bacterium]
MIRINLASPKGMMMGSQAAAGAEAAAGGTPVSDQARKDALVKILVIMMAPIALYFFEQQNIPTIRAELVQKQTKLNQLAEFNLKAENSVREIKKFKEDEQKIQARISALERIAKDRFREVKVLDLFQQVVPERLWLTRVDVKEGKILLGGLSTSDIDISTFMESLSKSVFLQDVVLISSAEQIQEGLSLKKFEIACMLDTSGSRQ